MHPLESSLSFFALSLFFCLQTVPVENFLSSVLSVFCLFSSLIRARYFLYLRRAIEWLVLRFGKRDGWQCLTMNFLAVADVSMSFFLPLTSPLQLPVPLLGLFAHLPSLRCVNSSLVHWDNSPKFLDLLLSYA